ncbi:MAG: LTA synthase family protein, partial [Tannerellaceae bacterium]|nr:LTA synthase family protein [Tannerellaceae bacterium]
LYSGIRRFRLPAYTGRGLRSRGWATGGYVLLAGLLFVVMRGGITTSTANVGRVYHSPDNFLNHAAINPCFSLLASLSKSDDFASQFRFLEEPRREELFRELFPQTPDSVERRMLLTTDRPEILIILLESFSSNVIESLGGIEGVTPEFDQLSREGILFRQAYASSFRTDRGLVAALSGYPGQPTTSVMKMPAKSQTLPSLSKSLVKEGYTTDVLYGGDIDFTNMRSYFLSSGYSKLVSDVNFPLSRRLSKWGAQDDVTFRHLYEEMKNRDMREAPRMTTFLTQSSHEPFEVPFRKWGDPYLNAVSFVDSCLGDFIAKIKKEPVWDNLLIVLVADHGYRYPYNLLEYSPERYHIPLLWLGGAVKEPVVVDQYMAQTDLPATLLGQLNLPADEFTFSRDLFSSSGVDPFAFYTFNNGFGFLDSTGRTVFDNEGELILLEEIMEPENNRLEKGQAILQTLYQDLGRR